MANLTIPLQTPLERVRLQTLIESGRFDAFGDYDMFETIETRVVAVHQDGFLRRIGLREPEALSQLQPILEDAVTMIDAVGARFGYALVYVKENGRELVVLAGINETEKGICTLELKRRTGEPPRDLLPLTRDANCAFLEGLDWGGSRHKVDVKITRRIWI